MAIGTGSHWDGPLLGSDKARGGLYEDVPTDLIARAQRATYFNEFLNNADDAELTVTALTAGTAAVTAATANGQMLLITAAVADQGLGSVQFSVAGNATAFVAPSVATQLQPAYTDREIAFGCGALLVDWSDNDWFIGLGGVDTTFMDATGVLLTTGGDNHVGFHHLLADANDVRLSSAGGGVANTQATLLSAAQSPVAVPANAAVDAQLFEFGVRIRGTTQVSFYVNGVLRHRRTMSNALAAQLTPTWTLVSGSGSANIMAVDYVWVSQTRGTSNT